MKFCFVSSDGLFLGVYNLIVGHNLKILQSSHLFDDYTHPIINLNLIPNQPKCQLAFNEIFCLQILYKQLKLR